MLKAARISKTMKSNKRVLAIITVLIVMSFIFLYAGHFLFDKVPQQPQPQPEPKQLPSVQEPVTHKHISTVINGNKQEIDLLEIDPRSEKIEMKPVLSFDSVFGFQKLSEMAAHSKAYAATNAGFFFEYGQPSGMVMIDGKLITKSSGRFPVFVVSEGKAYIKQLETKLWIKYRNKKYFVDNINTVGKPGGTVLYTVEYGDTNRADIPNTTITVQNNRIVKVGGYRGTARIPVEGSLLTLYESIASDFKGINFAEGEQIEFGYEPDPGKNAQAYECGSWIVRDGRVVIGERDEWVGVMTNNDPRTAVGILGDGRVLIITVDGRQPGYSAGLKGKELGDLLVDYGVTDAAMLDGGASTEMIVDEKIVNRPSFKGEERLLGGAIIVKYK